MTNQKDLKGLTCSKTVIPAGEWHSRLCGKPAKGFLKNGEPVCGIHLRAERKSEEGDARFERRIASLFAFRKEVRDARVGVKLSVHEAEHRTVIVDFDKLVEFLGREKR